MPEEHDRFWDAVLFCLSFCNEWSVVRCNYRQPTLLGIAREPSIEEGKWSGYFPAVLWKEVHQAGSMELVPIWKFRIEENLHGSWKNWERN